MLYYNYSNVENDVRLSTNKIYQSADLLACCIYLLVNSKILCSSVSSLSGLLSEVLVDSSLPLEPSSSLSFISFILLSLTFIVTCGFFVASSGLESFLEAKTDGSLHSSSLVKRLTDGCIPFKTEPKL